MVRRAFSYVNKKAKWEEAREQKELEDRITNTPNSFEMFETYNDPNVISKKISSPPTDELLMATYGLSYILEKTKNFLIGINQSIDNTIYIAEHAEDGDYERLVNLPSYDQMTPKESSRAMIKIIEEREHLSKQ